MSYAPNFTVANGVQTDFDLDFPYLAKSHVYVAVNGVNVTYSWVDSNTVQPTATPGAGTLVCVYRVTPNTPVVDFPDSGTLPESDLDAAFRQPLYMAEEAEHRAFNRSLYVSLSDDPNDLDELPLREARASRCILFDVDGQPTAGPEADKIAAAGANATAATSSASAASTSAATAAHNAANIPTPSVPADNGKYLRAKSDGSDDYELFSVTPGADVLGAASSTDRAIALFSGTTGKVVRPLSSVGTANHVLRSNGAGADPTFALMAEEAFANNSVALTKRKREGTSGHILYSGGAGADPYFGAPPAIGETNTASNLGSGGSNIYKQKVGVDFQFRQIKVATSGGSTGSMLSDASLSAAQNADDVTITLTNTWRSDAL